MVLGESKLSLECIDISPAPQHFLLGFGVVDAHIFSLSAKG
jgi:hypothetical protein